MKEIVIMVGVVFMATLAKTLCGFIFGPDGVKKRRYFVVQKRAGY